MILPRPEDWEMAQTPEEIKSLIEQDEALASALADVLAAAEAGDGTVVWDDVSEEITTAQWGRLLDTGLLIDAGGRFVIETQ